MIVPKRNVLIMYLTATCNLKCTYCYIDKSNALKNIDKILEDSFKDDYYFEFSKELFPKPEDLIRMEFWGGEPSYGLPRVYDLIPKFIEHYPNLTEFMMSTNFTTPSWFDDFYGFLKILSNYPKKHFHFHLQLSIDGPEYINDPNRGKGVTKKFLEHFNTFIKTADDNIPKNVDVEAHFKQTYSAETIHLLQDKQQIIDYFKFFDNLIEDSLNNIFFANVKLIPTVPNTASPSPHTKEDGILFANYCKLTREIEQENHFKNYKMITSYPLSKNFKYSYSCANPVGTCGSGCAVLGMLPNKMISVCHNGFTDLLAEYKQKCEQNKTWEDRSILTSLFSDLTTSMPLCMTLEQYKNYEKQVASFYDDKTTCQHFNLVLLIQTLAKMDQIDKKYSSYEKALEASEYLLHNLPRCVRDNIMVTGSLSMCPDGIVKLMLNGAKEYVERKDL